MPGAFLCQCRPARQIRRRQKWITFRGTKRAAESKLNELVRAAETGDFIEKSRVTVGEWLKEWLEKPIQPPARRQNTYDRYRHVLKKHLIPAVRPPVGSGCSPAAGFTFRRQVHQAFLRLEAESDEQRDDPGPQQHGSLYGPDGLGGRMVCGEHTD